MAAMVDLMARPASACQPAMRTPLHHGVPIPAMTARQPCQLSHPWSQGHAQSRPWAVHPGCPIKRRTHHRHICTAVPAPSVQQPASKVQPDLVLTADGLKHKVHVFGVQHTSSAADLAEYILRTRPAAVVVETSVTPEHGARPGNAITCQDRLVEGPAAFYMRMFCSVASGLAKQAEEHGGDISATGLWKQASSGAYRGEQLVYIAALACGSPLLFGDRPKDITYRRLYTMANPVQLDEGFGRQATTNYLEMLGRPLPRLTLDTATLSERIGMQEREAVMCSVAYNAARGVAHQPISSPDASQQQTAQDGSCIPCTQCTGDVVMVVGAAHLPGLELLWEGGRWQELVGGTDAVDSPLMSSPPLDSVPDREVGLRRGLLTALLRMSATREVLLDVETTLGPVPSHHQTAYQAVCEVYGATRTMLACLDADLLKEVCQGVKDESGQQTDLYSTLSYVRSIRPSQGGPGFSEEMVAFIRSLNFDLE